ncbi:MAG TPA: 5'-3' exonuclease [Candidatus Dormibacteraeota bacterium]|nr:5'-3' exonuclease [Candidatus Dormibacteraeota bacterium]
MATPPQPTRLDWLLLDGSSLIFRAFFGVPRTVVSPAGAPVNAVRGFLDYLTRFISEMRPANLLVASDDDWRPQFRVDAMPTYKSHRVAEPIPPELAPQMPIINRALTALGIARVGVPGFEAEDVIASMLQHARGRVDIISGDRDLFDLVRDPDIRVLYPAGKGALDVVDEAAIERKYGIPGRSYGAFAILRGDPSDGLPGLPGVGEKKAAELVRKHGGLEGLLRDGRLTTADRDYLESAVRVVLPIRDIPLEVPAAAVPREPADAAGLEVLKQEFGLGGAVDRLVRVLAGS